VPIGDPRGATADQFTGAEQCGSAVDGGVGGGFNRRMEHSSRYSLMPRAPFSARSPPVAIHGRRRSERCLPPGNRPRAGAGDAAIVAHCHLGLGTLYRRTGQRGQAQEYLPTAATMFREINMRFWLERAEENRRRFRAEDE